MTSPQLTLLMPVYNAEEFLERSLQSLQNQNFQNWKLIIINDGSNDRSAQVCDAYAKIDPRIQVIHQENQGVATTRNRLLEQVETPYFAFIDADDELNPRLYELLINHMLEKNVDLVMCGILEKKYVGDSIVGTVARTYPSSYLILDKMQDSFMAFSNSLLLNSPCNKIYKTSIVRESRIEFPDLKTGEDILFNLEYLKRINCLYVEEQPLYYYMRRNEDSITVSYIDSLYENGLIVHEATESFLEAKGLLTDINRQIIETNHLQSVFAALLNLNHKDCPLTIKEKKEVITSIVRRSYVQQCVKQNLRRKDIVGGTAQLVRIGNPTIILCIMNVIAIGRLLKKAIQLR